MLKVSPNGDQNVLFSGLDAPVLLKNAEALLPVLEQVLPSWPFTLTQENCAPAPCMTITGDGPDTYLCQTGDPDQPARRWDAVNAVCEMVVALAWAQIQSNPSWLCLHCAAVEFRGRLVLFPNRRRSGKSTLTAVLAQRGYRVFTDDFLPVQIDDKGAMFGVANGINPRLRLPLPDSFSDDFRSWVDHCTAFENAQYGYLAISSLAARGSMLPIGAIVVLDRQDDDKDPNLHDIASVDLLDDLITQNFARLAHSGRILMASHAVTQSAARYRLNYSDAEQAADFLELQFFSWPKPVTYVPLHALPSQSVALISAMQNEQPVFDPELTYQRANGTIQACVDEQLYVSDGHGLGIHRLNPGSSVIWSILEEHMNLVEITDLLSVAFPDECTTRIKTDCAKTLQQFVQSHLIVPACSLEEKVG